MATPDQLKSLIHINGLGPDSLKELAGKTPVVSIESGDLIFEEGDNDPYAVYVLEGEVSLTSKKGGGAKRKIVGGSEEARYALAQLKPRQYRGKAETDVKIVRVDSALLDRLITMEQAAQANGIEVVEFDGSQDSDWMMSLLRNAAFAQLPAANINALFQRLEPVEAKAGQIVIKQGDPGDYYYIIKSGKANVARKTQDGKVAMLSELSEGQSFGEEALLSGAPRNATVIMRTAGTLMRLSKKDFDALLKEPLVHWVDANEALALLKGGAVLIDVRLEGEFSRGAIKGSINIPLYLMRLKATTLYPNQQYILACDTGKRSCAAAFLLSQRGFNVSVLRGGLATLSRAA
jgi:CRP-like cAMP-binding protein